MIKEKYIMYVRKKKVYDGMQSHISIDINPSFIQILLSFSFTIMFIF
jgi:hypothetical protein